MEGLDCTHQQTAAIDYSASMAKPMMLKFDSGKEILKRLAQPSAGDYQARRGVRFRRDGASHRFVHTLNASIGDFRVLPRFWNNFNVRTDL